MNELIASLVLYLYWYLLCKRRKHFTAILINQFTTTKLNADYVEICCDNLIVSDALITLHQSLIDWLFIKGECWTRSDVNLFIFTISIPNSEM